MKKGIAIAVSTCLVLGGCATSSKDIAASYTSPIQYQHFDCDQLTAEVHRINTRLTQLGGRLDQAASNDAALMAVTLFLFWPAAFALGGTKQQEAEYARLKGESDAVQQAVIAKRCFGTPPAPVNNTALETPAPVAQVNNTALETPAPVAPAASRNASGLDCQGAICELRSKK
jgi:hypothetical protein